ncbi:hypothetical protein WA1_40565 [Scytonema hofmannii PCC 7110]|uniref:DUF5678 domain-containing protein n=1 Tax=Scytonema hofmannii PCC 7110 TaxID=128403 RepID=A0A139WYJ6_9CYAN|nr:hypothetical protein [Scytonema hofmannii]KYC37442.1 hypothetical protein WA1_40565 [Scytonema hofmannii PCC 7110]
MTETKRDRTARRGRIFPEIQWTEEQKAQGRAECLEFRKQSQVIFDRVKPEFMQTHYNWYMTIEPDSGEYFIFQDELESAKVAHEKYPGAKLYTFRINETGVCGTI